MKVTASVIVELSCSVFKTSEWVSALMTAFLLHLSHSISASITCCFKNLMMLHLALSLLLMILREVQLLPVFVREAGHFSLMFSIDFSLSVSMTGTF